MQQECDKSPNYPMNSMTTLRFRIREQRVSQPALVSGRLQDLRAIVGKPCHSVTPLLDLCHAGIYFNELSLTERAPVRRAIEEKDQTVPSHEVGQFMWLD